MEAMGRFGKAAVIVTILMLGAQLLYVADLSATLKSPSRVSSQAFQRYQIVNGTPAYARNIMLLDTQTGTSWISCNGADGETSWCILPQTGPTATKRAAQSPGAFEGAFDDLIPAKTPKSAPIVPPTRSAPALK
jgi:hypothetical protein